MTSFLLHRLVEQSSSEESYTEEEEEKEEGTDVFELAQKVTFVPFKHRPYVTSKPQIVHHLFTYVWSASLLR